MKEGLHVIFAIASITFGILLWSAVITRVAIYLWRDIVRLWKDTK